MKAHIGLLTAVLVGISIPALAATKGSCIESAHEVSMATKTNAIEVTMTPEFYPDETGKSGEYYQTIYEVITNSSGAVIGTNVVYSTNYVYYLTAKLHRGTEYSVWLTDKDGKYLMASNTVDFYDIFAAEATKDDEFEPMAMFQDISGKWGRMQVLVKDEWYIDEDDPEMSDPLNWYYIFQLSGNAGDSAVFHYTAVNALPVGIEENPVEITVSEQEKETPARPFVSGDYAFSYATDFKAGRRYLFATTGGTEGNPYTLDFGTPGKYTPYGPWAQTNNTSCSFDPDFDGLETITVSETTNSTAATQFGLRYRILPTRTIAAHNPKSLEVDGEGVEFVPGRVNTTENAYYDLIIDDNLYAFRVEKGVRYAVETTGSATNLLMRIYNGKGEIKYESTVKGNWSPDVRRGFLASENATYYVGIAQKLEDDDFDEPLAGNVVRLTAEKIVLDADEDVYLAPKLGIVGGNPCDFDEVGCASLQPLGKNRWYDSFCIVAREGFTYSFRVTTETQEPEGKLSAQVYLVDGKKQTTVRCIGDISSPPAGSPLSFKAEKNGIYRIRLSAANGLGTDYPIYKVHATVYETESGDSDGIGLLAVGNKGCETATWALAGESLRYPYGTTVALPANKKYTVKFGAVSGFVANPLQQSVTLAAGNVPSEAFTTYSDKFDHKDDSRAGATSWSLKSTVTTQQRTLWDDDPEDWFKIAAKDGCYYDFSFTAKSEGGDAEMTLADADGKTVSGLAGVSAVEKLALAKGTYYLKVAHANPAVPKDGSYAVAGKLANVGVISFAKTAVSAKDTATSVKLTVSRSAKDGMVRVRYRTDEGTATAGEHFIPQTGVLEWANGDGKAKTIEIKLIPKLGVWYAGGNKDFSVVLEDDGGEYPATFKTVRCTVTLTETSKDSVTAASVYAKAAAKPAKTKDETVSLRAGTYYGVVKTGLTTNGLPALASVTLTVAAKEAGNPSADKLSAKVQLAGKTYAFKTAKDESPWDEGEAGAGGVFKKRLVLTQKIGSVSVSNVLSVTVHDGVPGDWKEARMEDVSLTMNVPDVKGKGYQPDVAYTGMVCRQNAKIQGYLDAVTNFCGYYTISLVPSNVVLTSGAEAAEGSGVPSGNGYLTVTVDNKGKAKVAGLLADGTKVSSSAAACGIFADEGSAIGWSMLVPIYQAKSPYCFGGWLKLTARGDDPDDRPDGKSCKLVIDITSSELAWNNDNAALTHDGKEGWRMTLKPVGGWYDKIFNLQNYYRDAARTLSIATLSAEGFPRELLSVGYDFVTWANAQPDGGTIGLAGNALTMDKKALVKNGKLVDFDRSVNPCGVQVKFARATGLASGSLSLWSETADATAQKEIKGFKHNGVVTLDRDAAAESVLDPEILCAGTLSQTIAVKDPSGRSRKWMFSVPFNLKLNAEE